MARALGLRESFIHIGKEEDGGSDNETIIEVDDGDSVNSDSNKTALGAGESKEINR